MAFLNLIIILIFFDSSVFSMPLDTYCCVPCPFTCSPPCPCCCKCVDPSKSRGYLRMDYDNDFVDYDNSSDMSGPSIRPRQKPTDSKPGNPTTPQPDQKPVRNPNKTDSTGQDSPDVEPTSTRSGRPKKTSSNPRRFFTSLFSIPGAVADTLLSGEVVL